MVTERPARDLRIDLVRGAALLLIGSNHLPGNLLSEFTPRSWGYSDMAEVFVFLSGYAIGLRAAAKSTMSEQGIDFWYWRRAVQLYFAYVVTGVAIVLLIRQYHVSLLAGFLSENLLVAPPASLLRDIASLRSRLGHLAILPLYALLLVVTPFVARAVRLHPAWLGSGTLVVYLLSQWFPEFRLPPPWQSAIYYNPFAWQGMFFGGMTLAMLPASSPFILWPRRWLLPLALLFLGSLLLAKGNGVDFAFWLTSKSNLGPLRVFHFMALLVVGHALLPRQFTNWQQGVTAPIRLCGRRPLPTYCAGAVSVVLVTAWFVPQRIPIWGPVTENLFVWGGCLLGATLGECVGRLRRRLASTDTEAKEPASVIVVPKNSGQNGSH